MKFQLKQQVACTKQDGTLVLGVIAELTEENALFEQNGKEVEENLYCVLLNDESGKMYFEEFSESELKPSIEENTLFDIVSRISDSLVDEDLRDKTSEDIREIILDRGFSEN